MALPSVGTGLAIGTLALFSVCGWGPSNPRPNTQNPRPTPDTWRPDTGGWGETDIDIDTDFGTDTDEPDTDRDSDTDSDSDTTAPIVGVTVVSSVIASQVAVAESNTCAVTDGLVTCWGDDQFGVVSGAPTGIVSDIALGWDFACALSSGAVVCWGDDTFGITSGAPDGTFSQVSAGTFHACATTEAGDATCWGSNAWNKATVPEGVAFTHISAGDQHTCGVTAAGAVQCWGDSGTWTTPQQGPVVAVDAGHSETCWSTATTFQCQDALGLHDPYNTATFDLGRNGGLCFIVDGSVLCRDPIVSPPQAAADDPFTNLAIGYSHACAIARSGAVTCWGRSDEVGAFALPTE